MTSTITLPRSVVEQVLQSLHLGIAMYPNGGTAAVTIQATIDALRAALEQEPEAWDNCRGERQCRIWCGNKHCVSHPAPQPPAVEQPQGEQEPVAYYVMNGAALFQLFRSKSQADALAYDLQKRHDLSGSPAHFHVVPLYTHPQPQREPLTGEQQIAKTLCLHGLALVKTANGYDVLKLGQITAHKIGGDA